MARVKLQDLNSSLAFGGASKVVLPNDPSASGGSVAFWFRNDRRSEEYKRLFDCRATSGFSVQTSGFSSGKIAFYSWNGAGVGAGSVTSTDAYQQGVWSHFAAVWTASSVNLYLNGAAAGTAVLTNWAVPAGQKPTLGGPSTGAINSYIGNISSFIYCDNKHLTLDEVIAHMNGTTPAGATNVYKLDEGSGTTATDTSGNGNNGTITNGTWSTDTPSKKRTAISPITRSTVLRRPINNLVRNGDFEFAPEFTAATNTASKYIDGTASGSLSDGDYAQYGWYTSSACVAGFAVQYDPTVSRSGAGSMKLSALDTTGSLSVDSGNTSSASTLKMTAIPVAPSTSYTVTGYCKTSNVGTNGAGIVCVGYSAPFAFTANFNTNTISGTNDWTKLEATFTTGSTTRYIFVSLRNNVVGQISDAWFDDITLSPTTPITRLPA